MIDFICEVLGYTLQNSGYNTNYDSYVIYGAICCVFVLFILVVYLLVRFLQWMWRAVK